MHAHSDKFLIEFLSSDDSTNARSLGPTTKFCPHNPFGLRSNPHITYSKASQKIPSLNKAEAILQSSFLSNAQSARILIFNEIFISLSSVQDSLNAMSSYKAGKTPNVWQVLLSIPDGMKT